MDKTYLIHNIEFADSAANGHQTFDIELANLNKEPTDLTADITIIHNTAGSAPEINSFEGVSLTGAGGGMPIAQVKFNVTTEGDPVNNIVNIMTMSECTFTEVNLNGATLEQTSNVIDSKITYYILGNPLINLITVATEDESVYIWNPLLSAVVNSGDAVITEDNSIIISGDCEITIETNLD